MRPWSSRVSIPQDCKLQVTPLKVRPNLGAAATAALADESRLEIGKPYIVRPTVVAQSNMMAATAIDQHAAHTHLPHLAEGDLKWSAVGVRRCVAADSAGHAAIETRRGQESNLRSLVLQNAVEAQRVGDVEKSARNGVIDIPNFACPVGQNSGS